MPSAVQTVAAQLRTAPSAARTTPRPLLSTAAWQRRLQRQQSVFAAPARSLAATSAGRRGGRRLRSQAAAEVSDPGAGRPKANIVFVAEESETSLEAWLYTLDKLWRQGHSIKLLHVVPTVSATNSPSGSVYYFSNDNLEDLQQQLWRQAREFLDRHFLAHARCRAVPVEVVLLPEERHVPTGALLARKAEELRAEPLVLAAHDNAHWLSRWLRGGSSVSTHLLRHSRQPVLLLHPDQFEVEP